MFGGIVGGDMGTQIADVTIFSGSGVGRFPIIVYGGRAYLYNGFDSYAGKDVSEPGTGKELVAHAIHAWSKRAGRFKPLNCSELTAELARSELFGHREGAYTGGDYERKGAFLEADGGTLFLDEVGDMSLKTQSKVLRVLEEGVLEGRKTFGNTMKYINMGTSSNFGNMFSVAGASVFLPFLPMTSIQILLNNLLYDFSQVGIPLDHVDQEYLAKPRRWNIKSIRNFMIFIGPISSIFDYLTFF
jgi:hypothetical protein